MLMMLAMRVAEIRKPFPADADDARHAIRRNSSNDGVELIAMFYIHTAGNRGEAVQNHFQLMLTMLAMRVAEIRPMSGSN